MNQIDLSTTLAGVKMRCPTGIGSVAMPLVALNHLTPEIHAEVLLKHIDAGAGFLVLPICIDIPGDILKGLKKKAKSMRINSGPPASKFLKMETRGHGLDGLYFMSSLAGPPESFPNARGIEKVLKVIKSRISPDVPIIGNCGGFGAFSETYVSTAEALERAGCDLIELNLGCSLSANMENAVADYSNKRFPLYFTGGLVGDQPELVEELTRQVASAVSVPVGVKLSPETGFPRIVEIAERIQKAGGRFVNCSNNAVVVPPPDIYNNGKSSFPFIDDNFFSAGSGSYLRQIVFKQITAIARYVPELDIVCTGGLTTPEHIVEAIMLGASVTQFVTAMMYQGRDTIRKKVKFLQQYMEEQGYDTIDSFKGLALKHFKPSVDLNFKVGEVFAVVDEDKCNGCKRCINHICCATYFKNKKAWVNEEKCMGCGMCVALCPEDATRLYQRNSQPMVDSK